MYACSSPLCCVRGGRRCYTIQSQFSSSPTHRPYCGSSERSASCRDFPIRLTSPPPPSRAPSACRRRRSRTCPCPARSRRSSDLRPNARTNETNAFRSSRILLFLPRAFCGLPGHRADFISSDFATVKFYDDLLVQTRCLNISSGWCVNNRCVKAQERCWGRNRFSGRTRSTLDMKLRYRSILLYMQNLFPNPPQFVSVCTSSLDSPVLQRFDLLTDNNCCSCSRLLRDNARLTSQRTLVQLVSVCFATCIAALAFMEGKLASFEQNWFSRL